MWFLTNKANGKKLYLLCNRSYKVGRRQGVNVDIVIDGDQTVSRNHADILIKFDERQCTNLDHVASVTLTDTSRFGTFVNGTRVESIASLKASDVIRFGASVSVQFVLGHERLITTTSCIEKAADKTLVRRLCAQLGVYMLANWHAESRLVIMNSVNLSVKLTAALIAQRHVVTIKYLSDLVEWCAASVASPDTHTADMPQPASYLPPVEELELDATSNGATNFGPDEHRRTLFKNMLFVFFTAAQLQKMQNVVEMAGGECEPFDKSVHLDMVIKKKKSSSCEHRVVVFVQCGDRMRKSAAAADQVAVERLLDAHDQRLVDETEIGMAVLYVNVDAHTNPRCRLDSSSETSQTTSSSMQSTAPAPTAPQPQRPKNVNIPDTLLDANSGAPVSASAAQARAAAVQLTDSLVLQLAKRVRDDVSVINDTPASCFADSISVAAPPPPPPLTADQTTTTTMPTYLNSFTGAAVGPSPTKADTSSGWLSSPKKSTKKATTTTPHKSPKKAAAKSTSTSSSSIAAATRFEPLTPKSPQVKLFKLPEKPATDVIRVKSEPSSHHQSIKEDMLPPPPPPPPQPPPPPLAPPKSVHIKTPSTVVYSKLKKPPAESIRAKQETNDDGNSSTTTADVDMKPCDGVEHCQARVKYEKLVVVKERTRPALVDLLTTDGANERKNFKKFVKIPRASATRTAPPPQPLPPRSVTRSATAAAAAAAVGAGEAGSQRRRAAANNNSMFVCVKEEEMDINSQFEMFIKAKR